MLPASNHAGSAVRRRPFHPSDARTERVLTMVRFVFATVALAAIYFDPTDPARYSGFTYGLLAGYVIYSALLMAFLRSVKRPARSLPLLIHTLDLIVATLLTVLTEGPGSPFFVLFGFTLLAAGYRWGFRETVATGLVSGVLFGSEAVLMSSGTWPGELAEGEFELNRFVIRCTYLILLSLMIGYIAEQEKVARVAVAVGASAAERAVIARELHDGVIQSLIGLKMRVESLKPSGDGEGAAALIEETTHILTREVVNLRTIMFELTPIDVSARDLTILLADLVERFEHAKGIAARFVSTVTDGRASSHLCHEVGRIMQEALVNVHKHSDASNVVVSLAAEGVLWNLVVTDDGRGFDFDGRLSDGDLLRRRLGPRIIAERVRMLGGSLVIESHPNAGARLEISLPRATDVFNSWEADQG